MILKAKSLIQTAKYHWSNSQSPSIPKMLTLALMGFVPNPFNITLNSVQRETPEEELIAHAKGTTRYIYDTVHDEQGHIKALQNMGIDEELHRRILDLRYDEIKFIR